MTLLWLDQTGGSLYNINHMYQPEDEGLMWFM